MPLSTSAVGSLTIPVPTGGALSDLEDPTLLGLLSFLGFFLKDGLDDKLAELTPTSADACPVANRYPFDPEGTYVRNNFPALYAWPIKSERVQWSLLYECVIRDIRIMYVFEELAKPDGIRARHGIWGAVDKIFAKANERGRHASYQYDSEALGQQIARTFNWRKWEYVGCDFGFLAPIPGTVAPNAEWQEQRGYPAVMATFRVWERIDQDDLSDDDLAGDIEVNVDTGDSTEDTDEFMVRILPHPDGS